MDNNYVVSSLLPFIDEGEVSYYAELETEALTLLVSLAPFVNNSVQLKQLSNLKIEKLHEIYSILPTLQHDEVDNYFEDWESITS